MILLPSCLASLIRLSLAALLASSALLLEAGAANAKPGQKVTLSLAVEGSAPFSYVWKKNGVPLTGATDETYVISSFTAASAGTYTATVSNAIGSTTSDQATLVLASPPVITTQPAALTVVAGANATFTVVATGLPAPGYQWRRNGVALAGATAAALTLPGVVAGDTWDGGTYSVVVTNGAGTVTSSGAVLTVGKANQAPIIKTQPLSQTAAVGGSVTFFVVVTATPAATYQWRKYGINLAGATGASLVVSGVTAAAAGNYSVVATNLAGAVTSSDAVLTVAGAAGYVYADFNGDGKADILWQDILTGEHSLWLMAGTTRTGNVALKTVPKDWLIAGLGDFTADGKTDILWQNLVTGETSLWQMAGTVIATTTSLGVPAAGMQIAGAGDFSGDGKPDIIWRHSGTNVYTIRVMAGLVAGATYGLGPVAAEWSVAGTGDFNGDGRTDILWQSATEFGVWTMKNGACIGWVSLGAISGGWQIGGTGDYNGDGKPDILWQQATTGVRKVVLMAGVTKLSEVALGTVAPEWIMAN